MQILTAAMAAAGLLYLALAPRELREPALEPPAYVPWNIEVLDDGSSRVFGIRLGHSPLREAAALFGEPAGIALFETAQGHLSAEAYYEQLRPGLINGRLALSLAAEPTLLEGVAGRAVQRRPLPDGGARLAPAATDREALLDAPVETLTFIPHAQLDEAVLRSRFGEPAERVRIDERRTHWLYPEKGLDIMLDAQGREVLQYVAPRAFERLRDPLLERG